MGICFQRNGNYSIFNKIISVCTETRIIVTLI
uniref:Uncharacterized protein n=1 Tax=Heterorhabditis bacteriophora TaxID=37862 RepID=A0A1I7WI18_HETBA